MVLPQHEYSWLLEPLLYSVVHGFTPIHQHLTVTATLETCLLLLSLLWHAAALLLWCAASIDVHHPHTSVTVVCHVVRAYPQYVPPAMAEQLRLEEELEVRGGRDRLCVKP